MNNQTGFSPLPACKWDDFLSDGIEDLNFNVHKLMAHHLDLLRPRWNFRNHSVARIKGDGVIII